jgi:hypothetical protein
VCPAKILATNLIPKLNILIKYEKISIGIKIISNKKGLFGIKIFKKDKFCVNNPITNIELHIVIVKNKIKTT